MARGAPAAQEPGPSSSALPLASRPVPQAVTLPCLPPGLLVLMAWGTGTLAVSLATWRLQRERNYWLPGLEARGLSSSPDFTTAWLCDLNESPSLSLSLSVFVCEVGP